MGVIGRQIRPSVDWVDKSNILMKANINEGLAQISDFYALMQNAPARDYESKSRFAFELSTSFRINSFPSGYPAYPNL